jgi:hypothetical protein
VDTCDTRWNDVWHFGQELVLINGFASPNTEFGVTIK